MRKPNIRYICPYCYKTIYTIYERQHHDSPSLTESATQYKRCETNQDKCLKHEIICKKYREHMKTTGVRLIIQYC